MFPVNRLLHSVTPIRIKSGRSIVSTATGFFFFRDKRFYLVTNRHVVINEQEHFYPDALIIQVHDSDDLFRVHDIEINLYRDDKQLWIEHPKIFDSNTQAFSNNKVDVIILEVDITRVSGARFVYSTEKDFISLCLKSLLSKIFIPHR